MMLLRLLGGPLRRARPPFGANRYLPSFGAAQACLLALGCTTGVAIAYFLAARLGLALLTEDVAVFWPASGIAVGILVVLGRRARAAVVVGVIAATIVANLMGDRSLWTAVLMGFCNAGEAALTAWLIERWFGRAFAFDDVRHVLGFVAAAALGAAASAFGGAATMTLLHTAAPFWDVWPAWLLSDGVGIVVVAPLVIGLGELWRERPSPGEWIEGVGVVALLSVTSLYVVTHPAGSWVSFSPGALVLPFLLWLTARCRPAFAIAGACVASAAVLFGTTFGVGRFGDAGVALPERVKGAQAAMMVVTLFTLILAALFAARRRNEATLKESERRFRLTADAAPVMIWISGIDKLCTWFNKPWLDFVGRTMEQELGNGWSENVHADDFDRCLKTYVDAFDARQPFSMEYRLRRHDGEYRWVLDNGVPLWEPAGVFAGYIGSCIDITERKRAEADLAERQAQLAVFVEHAPAAIAMFDREMRYLAVSRRFVSDFRLPPEAQLIGKSHYQVFPEIPQHWRDIHARVLAGEGLSNEEDQFTRQDGRTEWTGWSMVPWRRADRSIGGALLLVEIRTDQVEARRALADSEARFRATFENAAVGVALVGTDGAILRANNSFARMLGYSVEELTTRIFQDLTHPDDLASNLSEFNKTLVGDAESYCIEKRYVRKDGGVVWASLTVGCVRKTDGGVDNFVSVIQDITERKRVEEQQRTLLAELDHRVKNALATVSAVVSHTQHGSRSVADFVAALDGRIRSMATTHELLSSHRWQGVSLAELLRRELAPYATCDNTEINGPDVLLKPEAGQAMAMVLHELATNAAKYGALSTKNGHVSIRWDRHLNGHTRSHLVLEWQEIGGPAVVALGNSSYGTSTIRDLIPYELGGTVDLVLAPEGIRCRLELPVDWLGNDGQPLRMHHGETEKPEFETGHWSEQTDR